LNRGGERGPERPLRIAQVAPPLEAVPPIGYGGTERIVAELVRELHRRGHEVTTYASGDSEIPGRHVQTVPLALRPTGFGGDPTPYLRQVADSILEHEADFDLIHMHIDPLNAEVARRASVPVVATFHGRLDAPWAREAFVDPPPGMVAISRDQARTHPGVDWTVIYHGITVEPPPLPATPGDDLCFVGRIAPEKGFLDAIEIARLTGRRLLAATKVATRPIDKEYEEAVIRPALARADVTLLGELSVTERDRLVASSRASLVPSTWPEPFGLVVIEALACGTPVLARRAGAIPEILRDGIDGFIGDDAQQLAFFDGLVGGLDRAAIRAGALERFSVTRMVDAYEALYRRLIAERATARD
jgi:glycosyltransferase involved in cell wall biosynthesis